MLFRLTLGWGWEEMEFEMGSRALAEKYRPPKVGHHFGRSAARHPPDRPAAARLPLPSAQVTVHHRESSEGVWRPWSMDLRQNRRDESATDLPRSPAVRFPAQSVGRGHLVPFRRPRPPGPKSKWGQLAAADALLRTRIDDSGEGPLTTGAKRPPNSRDGAR
jgi:hypothetical protein